jgi:hypothetical protein
MRGRLLRFEVGFAVINDSYNSNPVALQAMIELLAQTPGYSRRILAAGEMLELGPESAQLHRESGRQAAATKKIDWVFGVQGQASKIVGGAVEAGLPASHARFFPNSADAAAFLAEMLQPGDLLLVKGSRGVKMERIVEALREQFAPAGDLAPGPAGPARARLMVYFLVFHASPALAHYLNVFRYITVRTALASLSALFLGLLAGPWTIRRLRQMQIKQFIREEGPQPVTSPRPARPPWAAF